jgi:hypothetical protein
METTIYNGRKYGVYETTSGYDYIVLDAAFNDDDFRFVRECRVILQLHDGAVKVVSQINGKIFKVTKVKNNDQSRAVQLMLDFCK